jgi:hypothetical protein
MLLGVHGTRDNYRRLRPAPPTVADEICSCPSGTPTKLMSAGGFVSNPLSCLDCNLEVPPERLEFGEKLADDIANWLGTYGAIDALELASGPYEGWARAELLDPTSPPNSEGLRLARELGAYGRCYFWFWQPGLADDSWEPPKTCPVCEEPLDEYDGGIFRQLLCERDRLVVEGK